MRVWWVITWERPQVFSVMLLPSLRIARIEEEWEFCLEWFVLSVYLGIGGINDDDEEEEEEEPQEQNILPTLEEEDTMETKELPDETTTTSPPEEDHQEDTSTPPEVNEKEEDKTSTTTEEYIMPEPNSTGEFSCENLSSAPVFKFRRFYSFN